MINCRKWLREWLGRIKSPSAGSHIDFLKKGGIPWTPGYNEYKWKAIQETICAKDFGERVSTPRFGYRIDERVVELPWLLSRLPEGPGVLLDAGSALNHRSLLVHPKLAEKRLFISTLAPEAWNFCERGVSYVYEDLRQTCFREDFFDWIACISTLEHVGLDNTFLYTSDSGKKETDAGAYLPLIQMFRTRLKKGGRLFLSVPFGRPKNHGWFQVFNGAMLDGLSAQFAPAEVQETIFMYGDDRWSKASRMSAREALCYDINIDQTAAPDHCAFSRAVACLELRK